MKTKSSVGRSLLFLACFIAFTARAAPPEEAVLIEPSPAPPEAVPPPPAAPAPVSRWNLLLTGFLFSPEASVARNWEAQAQRASYGGLVGLRYALTPILGGHFYGGAHYLRGTANAPRVHLGLDLEISPFGLRIGSLEIVDLGLIAGLSNLSTGSAALSPHAGLRANVHFGTVAVTSSLRANGQYVLFETGVTTRI